MSANGFQFADFDLDLARYELRRNGHTLKLEKIPMDLLILLLRRNGELVSREEIVAKLWGKDVFVDTEQGINTAIRKIRQALHDDPEQPRFVQTVTGRGYRFIPTIHEVAPGPEQGAASDTAPSAAISMPRPARRSRLAWLVVALVLVAALVALGVGAGRGWLFSRVAPPIRSLAVLPLENLTGDPAQDYFVDGMHDALITELSKISALTTISRTSMLRYKQTTKNIREIARELNNVDAVVEGSVMREGERVRISVQLIHAPSDRHLWAESYERGLRDILVLQHDLAADVARQIQTKLDLGVAPSPVNPEAYDAYLRGRYFLNRRTKEDVGRAFEYFQQAIRIDPTYAAAYAGLSDCYSLEDGFFLGLAPDEAHREAKAAVLRAITLDDTLADAHASLAVSIWNERNLIGAEREFLRALNLNPSSSTSHNLYAQFLVRRGRIEQAIAEMRQALELDPYSIANTYGLGAVYYHARKYDLAMDLCWKALEMEPKSRQAFNWGTWAALAAKDGKQYVAAYQKWKPAEAEAVLKAYAAKQVRGLLEYELTRLNKGAGPGAAPFFRARIHAQLGEMDRAFALLEKAREEGGYEDRFFIDPLLDPLRGDTRFQDLLRRMNFPD